MLLIIKSKADSKTLKKVSKDLEGYIKVVVDVNKEILSAGGEMHADGGKFLLQDGSLQDDLWGGFQGGFTKAKPQDWLNF